MIAALPLVAVAALSAAPLSAPPDDSVAAPAPVAQIGTAASEWVTVVDATATVTVRAPSRWIDVEISPTTTPSPDDADQSVEMPLLTVAADLHEFYASWDLPGMILSARPHSDDLEAVIAQRNSGGCATEEREHFTRDDLTGVMVRLDGCGANAAGFIFVAANSPSNPDHTLLLELGGVGAAGDHVTATLLATFGFAPQGATPSHLDPEGGPIERQTVAPTDYPVSADAVTIADDTGRVSVAVPPAWIDVATTPGDTGTSVQPFVRASSDLDALMADAASGSFAAPGVILTAGPVRPDLGGVVRKIAVADNCAVGPLTPFGNGTFEGYVRRFELCGGDPGSWGAIVAANPRDDSFTMAMIVHLGGADASVLDTLLGSLAYDPAAVSADPLVDA